VEIGVFCGFSYLQKSFPRLYCRPYFINSFLFTQAGGGGNRGGGEDFPLQIIILLYNDFIIKLFYGKITFNGEIA
jgi:hypothetical protein